MKRKFEDIIELITQDERTHTIPILYIVQIIVVCADLGLFGGENDEFTT